MSHPIMFEAGDPVLARLRGLASVLPHVAERVSHGRPWFFVDAGSGGGTGFAVYGGGTRGPDRERHDQAVLVHVDDDERPARVQDARFFVPAYLGPKGWLGMDLSPDGTDWDEVAELLDASWRHAAPARLRRARDAGEGRAS